MSTQLSKIGDVFPTFFDDFFKPWSDRFDNGLLGRGLTVPPVNVTEEKDNYHVSVAAPGMKKKDFKVDVEGNMLTISASHEEEKEEKEKKYTRKEYNYSSFSRSFTIPQNVNQAKIEASYDNGVLTLSLPKKEDGKSNGSKQIAVN